MTGQTSRPLVIPAGQLVRVVSPYFVAGIIMRDDRCIFAAPILRWAFGMRREALRASFVRKGFTVKVIA